MGELLGKKMTYRTPVDRGDNNRTAQTGKMGKLLPRWKKKLSSLSSLEIYYFLLLENEQYTHIIES